MKGRYSIVNLNPNYKSEDKECINGARGAGSVLDAREHGALQRHPVIRKDTHER
jgi:hypothetical protein